MPMSKDDQPTPLWDNEKPRSHTVRVPRTEFNTAANRQALEYGKRRGIIPKSYGNLGTMLVEVD